MPSIAKIILTVSVGKKKKGIPHANYSATSCVCKSDKFFPKCVFECFYTLCRIHSLHSTKTLKTSDSHKYVSKRSKEIQAPLCPKTQGHCSS